MSCNYDIHVCLISAQAAANFLPVIQKDFKPKECLFFVSKEMKKNAEYLANAFREQHIKVTSFQLDDVTDFSNMENAMCEILEQYEDQNIALNVTGGTKLMALAAQNAFSLFKNPKPIFYLDTKKNCIMVINNKTIPDIELTAEISLPSYLTAYGVKIVNKPQTQIQPEYEDHIDEMKNVFIKHYDKYKKYLPSINAMASEAKNSGNKTKLDGRNYLDEFLTTEMHYRNLLDYVDNCIDFRNKDYREFMNGLWLEQYCLSQLNEIKKLGDVYCGIELGNGFFDTQKSNYSDTNVGNMNELDLAFMYKNKLHIIECKTLLMDKDKEKVENILYKLETIKDYGGSMTEKCLVSYFEVSDAVRNRAKELNIKIIDGEKIKNLKNALSDWIK